MNLDEAVNIIMPILLLLIALGFIWIKTPVGTWLGPHFKDFWNWIRGESENATVSEQSRSIVYE